MFHLPKHIINKILEYDSTYHEIYKKVLHQIEMFPLWNIQCLTDNTSIKTHYYPLNIATDMISHWNKYHYTYHINTLEDTGTRQLINFLDTSIINTVIPGIRQTLFEWIQYYNNILDVK